MKSPLTDRNWTATPLLHSPENKQNTSRSLLNDLDSPYGSLVDAKAVKETLDKNKLQPLKDGNATQELQPLQHLTITANQNDKHISNTLFPPPTSNSNEIANDPGKNSIHASNRLHPKMRMKAAYKSNPSQTSHSYIRQDGPRPDEIPSTSEIVSIGPTDIVLKGQELLMGKMRLGRFVRKLLPAFRTIKSEHLQSKFIVESLEKSDRRFVEWKDRANDVMQLVSHERVVSFLLATLTDKAKQKTIKNASDTPAPKKTAPNAKTSHVTHLDMQESTETRIPKSKKRSSEHLRSGSQDKGENAPTSKSSNQRGLGKGDLKKERNSGSKRQKTKDTKSLTATPEPASHTDGGFQSEKGEGLMKQLPHRKTGKANHMNSTKPLLPRAQNDSSLPGPQESVPLKKIESERLVASKGSAKKSVAKGSPTSKSERRENPKITIKTPFEEMKFQANVPYNSSSQKKASTTGTKSHAQKVGAKKALTKHTKGKDGSKSSKKKKSLPSVSKKKGVSGCHGKHAARNMDTQLIFKPQTSTGKKLPSRKRASDTQSTAPQHNTSSKSESRSKSRSRSKNVDTADVVVEKGTYLGIYWPLDRKFYSVMIEEAPAVPTATNDMLYSVKYLVDGAREKINLCDFAYMILLKEDAIEGYVDLPTAKRCHQLLGMSLAEAEEKDFLEYEAEQSEKLNQEFSSPKCTVSSEDESSSSTSTTSPENIASSSKSIGDSSNVHAADPTECDELVEGMANMAVVECISPAAIIESMKAEGVKPVDARLHLSKLLDHCATSQDVAGEVVQHGGIAAAVSMIHSFPKETEVLESADTLLLALSALGREWATQVASESFVQALTRVPGIIWAHDPVTDKGTTTSPSDCGVHGGVSVEIVPHDDKTKLPTSKTLYPVLHH